MISKKCTTIDSDFQDYVLLFSGGGGCALMDVSSRLILELNNSFFRLFSKMQHHEINLVPHSLH